MAEESDVSPYLPLRPVELQILACLSRGPLHGYAILKETEERSEGSAVPGLTTLYRTLKKLEEEELIRDCQDPDPRDDAARQRRTFTLTPLGSRVVRAELRRLQALTAGLEEGPLPGEGR